MLRTTNAIRQYIGMQRKADKLGGGKADNKPDSQFEKSELAKGQKIEMEHTDKPELAKEVTKDHLVEHKDYYRGLKPMEDMLTEIEKASSVSRAEACRIVLRAVVTGDFQKEIPMEVQKFIETNPERAQQFYKGKEKITTPAIQQYIRDKMNSGMPVKQEVAKNIGQMANQLNMSVVKDPNILEVMDFGIFGNSDEDWGRLKNIASPKLLQYVRHNTTVTAKEFLDGLKMHGSDLSKIITPDKII